MVLIISFKTKELDLTNEKKRHLLEISEETSQNVLQSMHISVRITVSLQVL